MILSNTHPKNMIIISNVKSSYFSIAYRYGGITFEGNKFDLIPEYDVLVLSKYTSKLKKHLKNGGLITNFEIKQK